MKAKKLDIVVLISGSGSNLQAFIDQTNELNINIKAVISNKADAYGIERAKQANIATLVLPHQNYDSREAFDRVLQSEIDNIKPKLIVLAGFMRILSSEFVSHYQDKRFILFTKIGFKSLYPIVAFILFERWMVI